VASCFLLTCFSWFLSQPLCPPSPPPAFLPSSLHYTASLFSRETILLTRTPITVYISDVPQMGKYFFVFFSEILSDYRVLPMLPIQNKKLIRRWDIERELFYDDVVHRTRITKNNRLAHNFRHRHRPVKVFTVNRKPSITTRKQQ